MGFFSSTFGLIAAMTRTRTYLSENSIFVDFSRTTHVDQIPWNRAATRKFQQACHRSNLVKSAPKGSKSFFP